MMCGRLLGPSNISRWEKNMAQLKQDGAEAYAWIEELPPNTWVKAWPFPVNLQNVTCY